MKTKFVFSICVLSFGSEKYLRETIDSVISQSVGFRKNVQLIILQIGDSEECAKLNKCYMGKYSKNIIWKHGLSGNIASAKNLGLDYSGGEYVAFLSEGDTFTKNVLDGVNRSFQENRELVDIIGIPLFCAGKKKELHEEHKFFGDLSKIINLNIEPYNFFSSSAGVFYKATCFESLKYDENLIASQDLDINLKLFEKKRYLGYVCDNKARCYHRKKEWDILPFEITKSDISAIRENSKLLTRYYDSYGEDAPAYFKEVVVHEIRKRYVWMLSFKDKEEEFFLAYNELEKLRKKLDPRFLVEESRWLDTQLYKVFYGSDLLRERLTLDDNGSLKIGHSKWVGVERLFVKIMGMEVQEKNLVITAFLRDFEIGNIQLVLRNGQGEETLGFSKRIQDNDNPYTSRFDSYILCRPTMYEFVIPLTKGTYEFFIKLEGTQDIYKVTKKIGLGPAMSISLRDRYIGRIVENKKIILTGRKILIENFNSKVYKYNFRATCKIFKKYGHFAWERLLSFKQKRYVLVSDRPFVAKDNGEAVFKYISEHRPELAKNTYMVLSKDSVDYERLKKIGKIAILGSLKHKYLFLNAKVVFSSHITDKFFKPFYGEDLKSYADLLDYKFVWLQHGVTMNDISKPANKYNKNIDYIVASIKGESQSFLSEKYFYSTNEVVDSVMPRFDYLQNENKNIIVCMPTWRRFLTGRVLKDGTHAAIEDFTDSEYFAAYSDILKSEKLNTLLVEHDYTFKFVLHPGMTTYYDDFKVYENEKVVILKNEDIEYSQIFSEARLLITDYSSVFFDFSYLNKPIIFYQFDKEKFFGVHYKEGHFSYEDDGFGDVVNTGSLLLASIEKCFNNNFKLEQKYEDRVKNSFFYNDTKCCERLIDRLVEDGKLS